MEDYHYDYQRVIEAENAEKEAPPDCPEPKKPYGKMIAADLVCAVAGGLVAVLFGIVTLAVNGDASALSPVGAGVSGVIYWGLFVLVPFLLAQSTYRTKRPRLAFMGCFYIQNILVSAFANVTTSILDVAENNLSVSDPQWNTVALFGASSGLSMVVTIAFYLAVLFLVVKRMAQNGLFEEETPKASFSGRKPINPTAAAVCAALMFFLRDGTGMLVTHFACEEPGIRNILLTVLSGFVSIGTVALCFAVGKASVGSPDGVWLFAVVVTSASAISCGKCVVDLIYAVLSALCGASMPAFADTVESVVSLAAGTAAAAFFGFYLVRRLGEDGNPGHQHLSE